jgi:hypothetical protein
MSIQQLATVLILGWIVLTALVRCFMTPEQIDFIRTARGAGVPWGTIATKLEKTIQQVRAAIGMPEYSQEPSTPAPWNQRERDLLNQPDRAEVSDR